jgi:hypothetical protein
VPDPAVQCVDEVARRASIVLGETVVRIDPRDKALSWKAAAVHPLEALETAYQGFAREATRGEADPDRRQAAEKACLRDFFFSDDGEPRLLGVGPGRPYEGQDFPLLEDKLREARAQLAGARLLIHLPPEERNERTVMKLRRHLESARRVAISLFRAFDLASFPPGPPSLIEVEAVLVRLSSIEDAPERELSRIGTQLAIVVDYLAQAVAGVGSVQMVYSIEDFLLFRLLVRYRVEAERELSPADIKRASGTLTELLNNGHPWLTAWLEAKIKELGQRIVEADGTDNTLFFLKGGRAVNYAMVPPEPGANDWDTQIVINPGLPAAEWYKVFGRVANAVLLALSGFKLELYLLLYDQAAKFLEELPPPVAAVSPPFDPDSDDAHAADCKAELIDVGLPRYGSVEAREQWLRMSGEGGILQVGGVPIPGYLYYIEEYVLLIREVFAGTSLSLRKAPERIKRLNRILRLAGVEAVVDREAAQIPVGLLTQSLAAISEFELTSQYVLILLLRQFVDAYGLIKETSLAKQFDDYFAAQLEEEAWPPYPDGLQILVDQLVEQRKWPPADAQLTNMVGFGQTISATMATHFEDRANFYAIHRELLTGFVHWVSAPFLQKDELEVQIAVRGSFAAHLHADYNRYARQDALEPVAYVSIGLYLGTLDADPAEALTLVTEAVATYMAKFPDYFSLVLDNERHTLRLYWKDADTIAPFRYTPLAVDIVVDPTPQRPLLAYVWGMPVLGLRDLIREYQEQAAAIDEFGRRSELRRTTAALTAILTGAVEPRIALPALLPLGEDRYRGSASVGIRAAEVGASAAGPGRYLMIGSANQEVARIGAYPPSYDPDAAFQVTLTENRPALREALTLGAGPADRTLDLLVVNQGEGGIGRFAGWMADDLREYLADPLIASNARANIIILDFPLSASLLGTFKPLCAPGGLILSRLYDSAGSLVTTALWTTIQPALAKRNLGAVQEALDARARAVSAGLTGQAHLDRVLAASDDNIAAHLSACPNDRDAISIIRYLPIAAAALRDPAAGLAEVHARLSALKRVPALGFMEQQMLAIVPAAARRFTAAVRATVAAQFQERVTAILTEPRYRLQLEVKGLGLFEGEPSRWGLLKQCRTRLLSLAAGLARCPTPFARWDQATASLTLDSALAAPTVPANVFQLMAVIDPKAPTDAAAVVGYLVDTQTISVLNQVTDYLNSRKSY